MASMALTVREVMVAVMAAAETVATADAQRACL
jgi:hypothetical protein